MMTGMQSFDTSYDIGVPSDYSSDYFCELVLNDFDLSKVKLEPYDYTNYEGSFYSEPLHYENAVKAEPQTYYDNNVDSDDRYYDRTLMDISSSLKTNRSDLKTSQRYQRKSSQSRMTEVLPKPEPITPGRKRGEGKRTGRGGSTPYTTVPLPPCKVCGGVATGFHFGVITCEACKAFFRRALIHKQAYKCLKDDSCEIIDKKLGNCSACRLKKCFALGMSKGGVRRGRYSIAIRTKAIVEAKAMEGIDAEAMVSNKRLKTSYSDDRLSFSSSSSSASLSPDSGYSGCDDGFDGLLEISDLDDDMNMTVTVISKSPSTPAPVPRNNELEFLIDALISCQDAVYPRLKKQFEDYKEDFQIKVYEELVIKDEIFDEVFGKTDCLTTEEFQTVFAETGIDIDDRLSSFNKKGKAMEESIAQYVNFAKIIPGFKSLNPKDVSKLLKAGHMEFWAFGNYKLFNKQLGICTAWDGSSGSTKELMSKFFDVEWIDQTLDYADTLKKLNLSITEMSLIRVIILTYTDRCTIMEREKVQALQEKFVECLQYHLAKTCAQPGRRLAKIFDRLLAVRDLTDFNLKCNRKFLQQWGFLMHDFPLWKEMLSFDEV